MNTLLFLLGLSIFVLGAYYIFYKKPSYSHLENQVFKGSEAIVDGKSIKFIIKTIEKDIDFSMGLFKTHAFNHRLTNLFKKKSFILRDREFHLEKPLLIKKNLSKKGYRSVYVCGFIYEHESDTLEVLKSLANPTPTLPPSNRESKH